MYATTNLNLLMSIRTDTCVVEGNFGNDQTIRDNVRFQVDLLPSILSELSIHTLCSYKCVLVSRERCRLVSKTMGK